MGKSSCEYGSNYEYDEYCDCYICLINLDEDEMSRFIQDKYSDCPHFSYGDEYKIVKKQI